MRRREFVVLGAAALALPLAARAQKVPVVGLLWNDSVKPSLYAATLLGALRERGYVVGRNLRIEDRVALEGYAPMAEGAAALVRAKVDLIVSYGATATQTAAKATKEIPIVMIMGADPVARGLAVSLSRPGGNVTGVTTLTGSLLGKGIELLKELVPGLSRVGVLLGSGAANYSLNVREAEAAARLLKLESHIGGVGAPGEIETTIAALAKSRVGAVYVVGSTLLASHSDRVVAAIAKHRIPAAYPSERYTESGGLMVYAPSVKKAFVRAAGYVDRILKGARPAEMPIEQTSDLELVINLRTAKALGIKIPQSILQRADRAIE
jgi:putative ABC transport system substrate-binding protein